MSNCTVLGQVVLQSVFAILSTVLAERIASTLLPITKADSERFNHLHEQCPHSMVHNTVEK